MFVLLHMCEYVYIWVVSRAFQLNSVIMVATNDDDLKIKTRIKREIEKNTKI